LEFGDFDSALGAVGMRFYCEGLAGHSFVEATLKAKNDSARSVAETAHFFVPVEAHAVDMFASDLRLLEAEVGGVARLKAALPR